MSNTDWSEGYVEGLALAWADRDPLESWTLAAPDARPIAPDVLREIVGDYLAKHDPFPEGMSVLVESRTTEGWDQAVIVDRVANDEWTVEYEDGREAWCSHTELAPG